MPKIEIIPDMDPLHPRRECENLGTFQVYHRRYASPDKITRDPPAIHADEIGLRVWGYDHGGIVYQTGDTNPFSCPWDSGFAGIIFCSREKACKWLGVQRLSPHHITQVKEILKDEVEIWNRYINGEFCGYRILDDNGEEIDSCWGFDSEEAALEAANANL